MRLQALPMQDVQGIEGFRYYSGLTEPERTVIRDEATWGQAWARIVGTLEPKPPAPTVDFGTSMVILVAMGTRGTGGYGITVVEAAEAGSDVVATVEEVSPGPSCATTQALTYPLHAVIVPARSEPVRFTERRRVVDCS